MQNDLGIDLHSSFDMIAGTSTGSIIAAAIACNIDLEEVITFYHEHGPSIFARRSFLGLNSLEFLFRSRYTKSELASVLKSVFGDKMLGDVDVPLLIPATDAGNGGVHVFKSRYSETFCRDPKVKIVDAVLASCSAPTYFDPTKVDEYLLADGGLWANNPSLAAVIDANKYLGIETKDIRILSVGTGHARTCYGVKTRKRWGLMNGWNRQEFINFIMSIQTQATDNYLRLLLDNEQVVRVNFETDLPLPLDDCTIMDDLASKAGKEFTKRSKQISKLIN